MPEAALGGSQGALEASWVGLGRSWGFLVGSQGVLGPLLGRSWDSVGSLLGGLVRSWGALRALF